MTASNLNVYIGLGATANASGINEQTAGGYARQLTSFSYDPIANEGKTSGPVTFGPSTAGAWPASSFVGIYDAPINGNLLFWWAIAPKAISTSNTFSLNADTLSFNAGVFAQSIGAGSVIGTKHGGPIITGSPISYNAANQSLIATPTVQTMLSSPALLTISAPNTYDVTLTQNTAFSLGSTTIGSFQLVRLILRQGNFGGHTPTLPSGIKWHGGNTPTPNSTLGRYDMFTFSTSDGGVTWFGGY